MNRLRRQRLDQAILDFHDSIDTIEIDKQLNGTATPEITRAIVQYELHERATIVRLLSQPLDELDEAHAMELRARFIRNLVNLCHRQESRRHKSSAENAPVRLEDGHPGKAKGAFGTKRISTDSGDDGARKRQRSINKGSNENLDIQEDQAKTQVITAVTGENDDSIQSPYPTVFADQVCLVCIGNDQLSKAERLRSFARKCTVQKHLKIHIKQGLFDQEFECRHPNCSEKLEGLNHFMNHAARVHRVFY